MKLPPGNYRLVVPLGPNMFPVQRESVQVTVAAGQTVSVKIELDTSIR